MLSAFRDEEILVLSPDVLPGTPRTKAGRMVFDLRAIDLIDSRLVARLIEIIRSVRPASVSVRRACARVRVQLVQLGLDRLMTIEGA